MSRNTLVKKSLILLAAILLFATLVFAACSKNDFKPVEMPATATAEGNGGLAVKYGDWLYYVNGYQSDVNAENTYTDVTDAPRVGSVVRIKLSDIEQLFEIQDSTNKTSTEKSDEIEQYVRDHAETVVPKFYYSGNTTTTQFTGLYIFGNRLYITTPNTDLTSNGDPLTSQLWLTSYKLDGSDEKQHFKFTDNTAQICLVQNGDEVVATYFVGSKLYYLDVDQGESKEVTVNEQTLSDSMKQLYTDSAKAENSITLSATNWDVAGKCVFFVDKLFNICKLNWGAQQYDVIVENTDPDSIHVHSEEDSTHVEAGDISYTINSVNNGQVYYTVSDAKNSDVSGAVLYWAQETSSPDDDHVAGYTDSLSGARGWKDGKVVVTTTDKQKDGTTLYGIAVIDGTDKHYVLSPEFNDQSVTIDRIEGDILYYTASSVKFTLDLSQAIDEVSVKEGTPYAKSLASVAGWAAPDFVDYGETHYIISTSTTGSLSIVRFDPSNRDKAQTSISLLLRAKAVEE